MKNSQYSAPDPGLHDLVEEYSADERCLDRRYQFSRSEAHIEAHRTLVMEWLDRSASLPFGQFSPAARVDDVLFRNYLRKRMRDLSLLSADRRKLDQIFPFGSALVQLEEGRVAMEVPDAKRIAAELTAIAHGITQVRQDAPTANDALGAAWLSELSEGLARWEKFYVGYDPSLDWWIREPLGKVRSELDGLRGDLNERKGGEIPGVPFGREALVEDLGFEFLPFTPEELIAVGDREYAWCEAEMQRAAHEVGFGDDWHAALEYVRETYVAPGEQTRVIRDLALEAIDYVERHDLLTVPDRAKLTWRMEMMSPAAQKVNPFFLGGEEIVVSYPTDTMTHEEKLMSMRGNNPNFSRATVQHELIPGHHMQQYMTDRFRRYRQLFTTPFWIEGWTLYWELLLWEREFPRTPEERIGMLFWRMHRCARIAFSLRFHLGELTTEQCVEILVDKVGHERLTAEGEVRRSFNGMYPPLYQAAYMIGGLQFRAISRELVGGGRMSYRQLHDQMMRENEMPPAMMRLVLRGESPERDTAPAWPLAL